MRIQHNIPALNAYRSYTQNVAAMKKNLEKLSSGYRINRAGDDAAGLAISEKMRAQITGLEVAQKNAKDGISLVQTAEGAMTEVHDMLNRMYELAEQSANGTYDNETDRAQMQKEIQSLSDEINRIADSSNFNGIKLVDGSLSKAGVAATTKMFGDLPGVGQVLGTNTVLHQAGGSGPANTTFSTDLHNLSVTGKAGQEFTINVGSTTLTGVLQKDFDDTTGPLTADKIAEALSDSSKTTEVKFNIGGVAYNSNQLTVGSAEFKAETIDPNTPTRVTFTQSNTADVDPDMKVTFGTAAGNAPKAIATVTSTAGTADGTGTVTPSGPTSSTMTATNGSVGSPSTISINLAGISLDTAGAVQMTIAGQNIISDNIAASDISNATNIAAAFDGKTFTYTNAGVTGTFTASVSGTTVTFTVDAAHETMAVAALNTASATFAGLPTQGDKAKVEVDFTNKTGADVIGGTVTVDDKTYEFIKAGQTAATGNVGVTVAEADTAATIVTAFQTAANGSKPTALGGTVTVTGDKVTFESASGSTATPTASATSVGGNATVTGDYNVSTTVLEKKAENAAERLASTYFSLTEDMVGQGNSIKIASSNYVFQTEKGKVPELGANDVVVDISDLDAEAADYMTRVAERLTKAAEDNEVYTVGHDGSRITVTETVAHATDLANPATGYPPADGYDLTTLEGIQKSLGYSTAAKAGSGGLSLQIGDTADSYNKLTVSINDCHAAAMGLGDIDISTQDGASAAMKKIKSAINYVSDVRGDLGALQNRLDHTINNLSVMHENIQDAESTIRDVDIAEEMMAYTKNNILVQSSQAMLAQANQLPQGVLQLLQ